jgi:ABC-type transporter Mla MlaB component
MSRCSEQSQGQPSGVIKAATDMTSCDQLRQLYGCCGQMLRQGAKRLILDLKSVAQADTKLMACLVAIYRLARGCAARVEFCPSPAVLQVVQVCKLEWLMERTSPQQPIRP